MSNKEKYTDTFFEITDTNLEKIKNAYKIIDVTWLDSNQVKSKVFYDKDFKDNPKKEETIINMLDYYLHHKDADIYKKTDYLCSEREKFCICNVHADDFRRIFNENNYEPEKKYISWFRTQS